jgi:hypothetical protein
MAFRTRGCCVFGLLLDIVILSLSNGAQVFENPKPHMFVRGYLTTGSNVNTRCVLICPGIAAGIVRSLKGERATGVLRVEH